MSGDYASTTAGAVIVAVMRLSLYQPRSVGGPSAVGAVVVEKDGGSDSGVATNTSGI